MYIYIHVYINSVTRMCSEVASYFAVTNMTLLYHGEQIQTTPLRAV